MGRTRPVLGRIGEGVRGHGIRGGPECHPGRADGVGPGATIRGCPVLYQRGRAFAYGRSCLRLSHGLTGRVIAGGVTLFSAHTGPGDTGPHRCRCPTPPLAKQSKAVISCPQQRSQQAAPSFRQGADRVHRTGVRGRCFGTVSSRFSSGSRHLRRESARLRSPRVAGSSGDP